MTPTSFFVKFFLKLTVQNYKSEPTKQSMDKKTESDAHHIQLYALPFYTVFNYF